MTDLRGMQKQNRTRKYPETDFKGYREELPEEGDVLEMFDTSEIERKHFSKK